MWSVFIFALAHKALDISEISWTAVLSQPVDPESRRTFIRRFSLHLSIVTLGSNTQSQQSGSITWRTGAVMLFQMGKEKMVNKHKIQLEKKFSSVHWLSALRSMRTVSVVSCVLALCLMIDLNGHATDKDYEAISNGRCSLGCKHCSIIMSPLKRQDTTTVHSSACCHTWKTHSKTSPFFTYFRKCTVTKSVTVVECLLSSLVCFCPQRHNDV